METPAETAVRLLGALDDLIDQEAHLLRTMEFVAAVELQERTAPLVTRLAELATDPAVAVLRPRVAALCARRERNHLLLDTHLARLQAELERVGEARRRLKRVGPAYHQPAATPSASRLNSAA